MANSESFLSSSKGKKLLASVASYLSLNGITRDAIPSDPFLSRVPWGVIHSAFQFLERRDADPLQKHFLQNYNLDSGLLDIQEYAEPKFQSLESLRWTTYDESPKTILSNVKHLVRTPLDLFVIFSLHHEQTSLLLFSSPIFRDGWYFFRCLRTTEEISRKELDLSFLDLPPFGIPSMNLRTSQIHKLYKFPGSFIATPEEQQSFVIKMFDVLRGNFFAFSQPSFKDSPQEDPPGEEPRQAGAPENGERLQPRDWSRPTTGRRVSEAAREPPF